MFQIKSFKGKLVIIAPNSIEDFDEVKGHLTSSGYKNLKIKGQNEKRRVTLPTFRVISEIHLDDTLKSVSQFFDNQTCL